MATAKSDIENFRNPTGFWSHEGSFSVELIPDADTSIAPPSADVRGNTVHVRNGQVKQTMGGIQLHSQGSPFYWGYPSIKVIRDGEGNLLWVNYYYR